MIDTCFFLLVCVKCDCFRSQDVVFSLCLASLKIESLQMLVMDMIFYVVPDWLLLSQGPPECEVGGLEKQEIRLCVFST